MQKNIVHTCYGCKFYYRVNSDGKKEWCVPFCYRHCDIKNVWDCDYFENNGEPNVLTKEKLAEMKGVQEIDGEIIQKLCSCFNGSFINDEGEFVAHVQSNQYFILRNCKTELDVKCKVLEWFSRGAYKTEPYRTRKKNDEFHQFMLSGINQFLETDFREAGIELIYARLGNACNHDKTIRFVESGYDFDILLKEV